MHVTRQSEFPCCWPDGCSASGNGQITAKHHRLIWGDLYDLNRSGQITQIVENSLLHIDVYEDH
jgi:hypothetical protein